MRSGPVSATAVPEERPAALEGLPGPAAAGAWRRIRVPQRQLVCRRCLRRAEGGRGRALPLRARGQRAAAAGGDRAVGLCPATAGRVFGGRSGTVGEAARI